MKKKEIIQISVTGVLLIVLLVLVLKGPKEKKDESVPVYLDEISYDQIMSEQIGRPKGLYVRLDRETKNLKLRRNPFSEQHLTVVSGPYLNGIFWDPINPKAIINGRIVENGSRIEGYTVIEIKKNSIILMDNTDETEVRLQLLE